MKQGQIDSDKQNKKRKPRLAKVGTKKQLQLEYQRNIMVQQQQQQQLQRHQQLQQQQQQL